MKYVMLRNANTGTLFAVMGLGLDCTHDRLASAFPGYLVVSAGLVRFRENGLADTYGYSTGLAKTPHADDARFLTALYRGGTAGAPSLNQAKAVGDKLEAVSETQIPPPPAGSQL